MTEVIVGPLIVDEMEVGPRTRQVPGGVLYALAGARAWSGGCRLVTNAGDDFAELCGGWMRANGLTTRYVRTTLDRTKRYRLRYVEAGLFREDPVFDPALHARILRQDRRTPDHVLAAVDGSTRGVYVEAAGDDPLWDDRRIRALARRMPLMWEVQTSSALEPAERARTLDVARAVGLFSVNLPEACALFSVAGEAAAVDAILAFGVPCYFRVGARGSYLLADGDVHFEPSVRVADLVDPTGCGNASTAAALVALASGAPAADVPLMGNISASLVLRQFGPPPRLSGPPDAAARDLLTGTRAVTRPRER